MRKFLTVLLALAVGAAFAAAVWADEMPEGVEIQYPEGRAAQGMEEPVEQEMPEETEPEASEELMAAPEPVLAAAPQTGDSTTLLALSSLGLSLLALSWAKRLKAAQE